MAEVVEMLKWFKPVPPVLHVSTSRGTIGVACKSGSWCVGTGVDLARIARVAPVSSSIVSPLNRRAVRKQAICASVVSPSMISFIVSTISASVRSFPAITC